MPETKYTIMANNLNTLKGHLCWSIIVSGGLENGASLSFGGQVARGKPLEAPTLSPEQRAFAGQYELAIAECTWRLDAEHTIVTSWSDNPDMQRRALAYLLGVKVVDYDITWPGLDLTLYFENILALRLFCDQTDPDDSGHNYTLYTPEHRFLVGVRSALTMAPRGTP